MRATRLCELEKENHVLLTEVARLRQMNELVHRRMSMRQQAADAHEMGLQRKVAEPKLERKQCVCISGLSAQCGKTRNPADTVADIRARIRIAHEAIEHAVSYCKHILRSDTIQPYDRIKKDVVELLGAIASQHSMYV